MKILVLNGPNLDLTGKREPDIYGDRSLGDIMDGLRAHAEAVGVSVAHMQSNHEGVLIDMIHAAPALYDGILLNAGAFTHYSYALRDAVACCTIPVGEVHLSDITIREAFRANDVLEEVCRFRVMGMGAGGYAAALDKMKELLEN